MIEGYKKEENKLRPLVKLGLDIDFIIEESTPEGLKILSAWLESKANYIKCVIEIEDKLC